MTTSRPITEPAAWADAVRAHQLPVFDAAAPGRVVVLSAHPDDETIGAGGAMLALQAAGARLTLVVATDGEAAYPGLDAAARRDLGRARRTELADALAVLGLDGVTVHWLGLPDSALDEHADALRDGLAPLLADADAHLAPAPWDPHPDHRAVAAAAAAVAPPTSHGWSYPIWTWAWTRPDDAAVPWVHAHVVPLDVAVRELRRAAVDRFASQVEPGPDGSPPVLAAGLLRHLDRDVDLLFREPRTVSAPVERFTELYAAGDPWAAGSWYERRKRDVLLAALPRERYGVAFEPGCGAGELSAALAARCDRLLASDPVPAAVDRCRDRGVSAEVAALPEAVPAGPIDLAVFSEVLYYLDDATLAATLDRTVAALAPDADLVLLHWRGWPAEAPRDAAATHRRVADRPELERIVEHVDEGFLLHVLRRR